jgi:hypothetical protein
MKRTRTWLTLVVLSSGMLFINACLSSFWQGFRGTSWPSSNRWVNLAYDVVVETTLQNTQ